MRKLLAPNLSDRKERIMKLLHISDLHLGISVLGRSMREEQAQFIEFLAQTAREKDAAAVLISGDVYDRAIGSPEAIELYDNMLEKLCLDVGVKVCIIAGNHDGAERLSSLSSLLKRAGLHIVGRLTVPVPKVRIEKNGEQADVFMLPYFNLDDARYALQNAELKSLAEAAERIIETVEPEGGVPSVLMAHTFLRGGVTSKSDRAACVGGATMLGADLFCKVDYVALGHLHKPQDISTKARYCGTPLQYSFSEEGQVKTITVLDTADMSREYVEIPCGRKFRTITGTLSQLMQGESEDYVRICVTDCAQDALIFEQLKERYPNMLTMMGAQEQAGSADITAEELGSLTNEDILAEFMKEAAGRPPSEREVSWFLDACREAMR